MNVIDQEKMNQIAENSHALFAHNHFGPDGVRALQTLIRTISQIYRIVEPANRTARLVIVRPIAAQDLLKNAMHTLHGPNSIGHELDAECVVEASAGGLLRVFSLVGQDLSTISNDAIVYEYHNRQEWFVIAGTRYEIVNPSRAHVSVFSRPTFSSLDEALERYRIYSVRNSSCFILEEAWSDSKRLFWKIRPEQIMRKSLHQFLKDVFPEAEIRPEQVVDESHPVDIKVTWHDTNKRALIEIKWLGKSRDENSHITTTYTDSRANEGANQLANYLDADKTAGPGLKSRGYLVVIDGRRRGLLETSQTIDSTNGLYYRDRDVSFNPDYHGLRNDFALPIRMFAEPILN